MTPPTRRSRKPCERSCTSASPAGSRTRRRAGRARRDSRLPPRAGSPLQASELGHPDLGLALRAGGRLAAAGQARPGAATIGPRTRLLERALELTRPSRLDVVLELDLAHAVSTRDAPAAVAVADAAADRARDAGDDGELLARSALATSGCGSGPIQPSTSSSSSRGRRCHASSRQATTPASPTSGSCSASGLRTAAAATRTGHTRSERSSATHASRVGGPWEVLLERTRLWVAAGGRGTEHARRLLPENPHPWPHLCRAPGCSPCSAASTRRPRSCASRRTLSRADR